MSAFLGPAVSVGATALGALLGRPRKKKSINLQALIDKYLAMRPGGYVTAEDQAAAERTRSRLAGAAGESARGRRIQARRGVQARGLAGSPADLAVETQIGQDEALARQGAAEQGAAQEYNAYDQNKGYLQGMIARAFGADVGAEMENARLDQARQSTFWNSILDVAPTLGEYFKPNTPSPSAMPDYSAGGAYIPRIGARPSTAIGSPPAASYQPQTKVPSYRTPRLLPAY